MSGLAMLPAAGAAPSFFERRLSPCSVRSGTTPQLGPRPEATALVACALAPRFTAPIGSRRHMGCSKGSFDEARNARCVSVTAPHTDRQDGKFPSRSVGGAGNTRSSEGSDGTRTDAKRSLPGALGRVPHRSQCVTRASPSGANQPGLDRRHTARPRCRTYCSSFWWLHILPRVGRSGYPCGRRINGHADPHTTLTDASE